MKSLSPQNMTTVTVIIPYFQRKTGILRRALDTILQQRLSPNVRVDIIVVDDGSPVAAKTDIERLKFTPPFRLNLIVQPNAGVAAARNAGLQNVGAETTYVAFLDSDDLWDPAHLATALSALDAGFDYYFGDHRRIGSHDSFFKTRAFTPPLLPHPDGGNLYEIDKDSFTDAHLQFAISHMSTVVFRWCAAPGIRFNESFRLAGEDVVYLLQVAHKCRRLCYLSDILVTCADGVNIWASRYDWDAPTHMAGQLCRMLSMQEIEKTLPLTKQNRSFAAKVVTQLRRYFAYMSIREFVKRRRLWPPSVNEMRRNDPGFWSWYLPCFLYVALCYPLRLYTPED